MTVPAYTDISHFRAPYKNAIIGGFGVEQQVPTPPPPPTNGALTVEMFVTTDDRGYRTVKKELQPILGKTLEVYGATFMGGVGNQVKIAPYTPEQLAVAATDPKAAAFLESMSVATWIKKQVADGQVVFATVGTLVAIMSGVSVPGSDTLGTWPSGTEEAKEAAKSPIGVVIAGDPEGGFTMASMGPVAIAVGAAVVIGVGYWAITRKKGGAAAQF